MDVERKNEEKTVQEIERERRVRIFQVHAPPRDT